MSAAWRVIGLGEVLWDLFPDSRQPGGATANVAFHAAQLGCAGAVVSRVGQDVLGEEIVRYLADHGLDTSCIQHDATAPTGMVTVEMTDLGHRFVIHEDVAWDQLEFTPQLQQAMATASAVCFGTLAQRSPKSREAIQRCLFETPDDCLIVFDINIRQHFYDRATIERSLQSADIVKLNGDEVELLAPMLGLSTSDLPQFARQICERFGPQFVCITRGADGCLVVAPDEQVDVPGLPVTVVDTVGAGDAFTAALLVSQLASWPLRQSAEFANRVGALVANRAGAMPDLKAEYAALRAEFRSTESHHEQQ